MYTFIHLNSHFSPITIKIEIFIQELIFTDHISSFALILNLPTSEPNNSSSTPMFPLQW